MRMSRATSLAVLVLVSLGYAAGASDTVQATSEDPTIDGTFEVGPDGHHLFLRCVGQGTPTIVLEAGTDAAGSEVFPTAFIDSLAVANMTCVYDRVGTGHSDPPTAPRRTIDDVVNDLDELLDVAAVPGPYLLVGSSGGGGVVVEYAAATSIALRA